ncbi:MAG TPA: hypothetical protein VK203_13430 [Nostocaceae cyanobacterium]|nr:hypothetical protein [Nostocaceae cyanobacterium]
MDFKSKIAIAWNGDPPKVKYIAEPMPGTPYLRLLGNGISSTPIDKFLNYLEQDKAKQKGKYFTFPINSNQTEEDLYVLEGWEVYTSPESCYEAIVILYYSALYPYQVIKKYMGEVMAEEYLQETVSALN